MPLSSKRLQLPVQVLRNLPDFLTTVLFPVEQPELRGGIVLVEELSAGEVAGPAGEALEFRDGGEGLALGVEALGEPRRRGLVQQTAGPERRRQVARKQLGHRLKKESRQIRPPRGFAGVEERR